MKLTDSDRFQLHPRYLTRSIPVLTCDKCKTSDHHIMFVLDSERKQEILLCPTCYIWAMDVLHYALTNYAKFKQAYNPRKHRVVSDKSKTLLDWLLTVKYDDAQEGATA